MFQSDVDIGNRALQHCGLPRMDAVLGFSEQSQRASEVSFAYGKVKQAELGRNIWTFATRRAALRPLDVNTVLLAPTMWVVGTTYFRGSIVSDQTGFLWISKIPNNTGNQPQNSYTWEPYFGPMTASLYDGTQSYFAGEVVYTAPGDGTYNVYLSLVSGNQLDPSLPNLWSLVTTYFQNQVVQVFPAWASGTTYSQGQTVTYTDGNTYSSLVNSNTANIPANTIGTDWALMPDLQLVATQTNAQQTFNTLTAYGSPSPIIEWYSGTSYAIGNYVQFDGNTYVSLTNSNTGNTPNAAASSYWAEVTGGTLYMSLIDLNTNNSPASSPALWSGSTSYSIGNTVGGSDGIIYTSRVNSNLNNNPAGSINPTDWTAGALLPWTTVFTQGGGNQQWLQIGGAAFPSGVALSTQDILYPLGAGPASQSTTRNAYRLPAGFLKPAPQNPKAGTQSELGFPTNPIADDWVYESNYIVSAYAGVIVYRFIADVVDVTQWPALFCEGLACAIALAVDKILENSNADVQEIQGEYRVFMGQARVSNLIEIGWVEPFLDDLIACRY